MLDYVMSGSSVDAYTFDSDSAAQQIEVPGGRVSHVWRPHCDPSINHLLDVAVDPSLENERSMTHAIIRINHSTIYGKSSGLQSDIKHQFEDFLASQVVSNLIENNHFWQVSNLIDDGPHSNSYRHVYLQPKKKPRKD